jgi:hypothetical protein
MKSEYWAMIAGAIIGSVLGVYVVTRMINKLVSCEELKRENQMLREVILESDSLNQRLIQELQQQPYVDGQCKE